jgi:predicted nuclease of predicted toxin-antitoxin system
LIGRGKCAGVLIDECLSATLADIATHRGLVALAVNRLRRLRGRGDHVVARYALVNEYVLVTNNLVEFERIYQELEFHPGIVFFDCPSKLRKKAWQAKMMEMALDELELEDPVQQAIVISATQTGDR